VGHLIASLIHELKILPAAYVYIVVALLVFGEAALFIGFILPGETAVIVAGVVAAQGHVNVFIVGLLVVVAAIVGDSVGYAIGREYGEHLLKLPLVRQRRGALEAALQSLHKRGPLYVFLGRFTAFLRAVMPGLAGMSRLHYRRFFIANAAGGIVWGVGFVALGFSAGKALKKMEHYASWLSVTLLCLAVVAVVFFHVRKKRAEKRRDSQD
jgi:membrane protein DedA with SNARE-associated domain